MRLIAATNRDLKAMAAEGTFREDLYYRLNVVNLQLPPLREHREDIPTLIDHYLKLASEDNGRKLTGIANDATAVLVSYDWPGNIRELRNCIERMVVLARGTVLTVSDIPHDIMEAVAAQFEPQPNTAAASSSSSQSSASTQAPPPMMPATLDIHDNELAAIRQALERTDGNRTKAAELLGISRRTLQRKLLQYPELDT